MTDNIVQVTVGTKGADENGPPSVALNITQGTFQYAGFHTAEDARRIGSALIDAADEVLTAQAKLAAMRESDVIASDRVPMRCVYCGAEDNYRCCEYGRDKR